MILSILTTINTFMKMVRMPSMRVPEPYRQSAIAAISSPEKRRSGVHRAEDWFLLEGRVVQSHMVRRPTSVSAWKWLPPYTIYSLRKQSLSRMMVRLSQLMKKMMARRNQLHTLMMLSAELMRKMPDTASSRMLAHFFRSDTFPHTYSTSSEKDTMQSVQKNLLSISSLPSSRNRFMKNCSMRRSASGCLRNSLQSRVKIMMFRKSDQCRKNCHENSSRMLSSRKQSPSPYIRNLRCALPCAKCSGNTNLRCGQTLITEQLEKIS